MKQNTTIEITTISNQFETCKNPCDNMPVIYSLALSVFLLLVVSYQKYHIDRKNDVSDYWQFFLEVPIDLGNVAISVLVTYYFLVQDINVIFLFVFIELFVMLISMTLRNTSISLLCEDNIIVRKIFFKVCLEFLLVLTPIVVLFILILK